VTYQVRGLLGVVLFAAGMAVGGLGVYTYDHRPTAPPRRWEATIYLPTHDASGKPFEADRWQEAVQVIVNECGGATIGAPQEGWWQDEAKTITHEPVRPITVSFPRTALPAFKQAASEAGKKLGQRMLYIRYEEPRVEILPASEYGK
jgi:hypothetical protein